MYDPKIENAIAESVKFNYDDSKCIRSLDIWVKTKSGGACPSYYLGRFLDCVMEVLDTDMFEEGKSYPVRVKSTGIGGRITDIGHWTENIWISDYTKKQDKVYELIDESITEAQNWCDDEDNNDAIPTMNSLLENFKKLKEMMKKL